MEIIKLLIGFTIFDCFFLGFAYLYLLMFKNETDVLDEKKRDRQSYKVGIGLGLLYYISMKLTIIIL